MKKDLLRHLFSGFYLGLLSCAWLGYLVGLRLLNWNPGLWNKLTDVAGVLIFSTLMYALLGLVAGIFFTLGLKIILSLLKGSDDKTGFVRNWLIIYSGLTILVFAYLTITRTRPGVHVLVYDTPLVVTYCVTLLAGYWLFAKRLQKAGRGIIPATALPVILTALIALGISYFATGKQPPAPLGDKGEIAQALQSARKEVKVFLFGVDGADWRMIDPLISQGKMPAMADLMKRGVRANFESLPTLKSPIIWNSMATGKLPHKHGIEDFGSFQFPLMKSSFLHYPDGIGFYRLVITLLPRANLPVTSTARRVETFWDILSQADIASGVIGWWATWPADPIKGVMLSDRFTYTLFNPNANALGLKEGQVQPPELLDELLPFVRTSDSLTERELGRFIKGEISDRIYPADWTASGREEWNPLYQLKLALSSGESFFNAGMYIYQTVHPSLLTIYLEGNDMVSHFFWQYMDPYIYTDSISAEDLERFGEVLPRYYCYWDSLLGEAVKRLEPGTDIMVVSDHGFGPDSCPKVPFRGGEHQPRGIFLAAGPHFKEEVTLNDASVMDLAPTVLYLYGLPIGEDMDGKVMTEVFKDEFLQTNPLQTIKSYETGRRRQSHLVKSSVDEEIKQQLRSLGYTK